MTSVLMGPMPPRCSATMAPTVIKIETTDRDVTRQTSDPPSGHGDRCSHTNRSKRSICLDLKNPKGATRIAADRVGRVLVYNVRRRRWRGCNSATIGLEDQPAPGLCGRVRLGQDGPYAAKPAYDDLSPGRHRLPALMAQTSDGVPLLSPTRWSTASWGHGGRGDCASLVHRDRTGAVSVWISRCSRPWRVS